MVAYTDTFCLLGRQNQTLNTVQTPSALGHEWQLMCGACASVQQVIFEKAKHLTIQPTTKLCNTESTLEDMKRGFCILNQQSQFGGLYSGGEAKKTEKQITYEGTSYYMSMSFRKFSDFIKQVCKGYKLFQIYISV